MEPKACPDSDLADFKGHFEGDTCLEWRPAADKRHK